MKPETESSVSKAKTKRKAAARSSGSSPKKKAAKCESGPKIDNGVTPEPTKREIVSSTASPNHVSDQEFLDTVKITVYKKLLDNELDLKIDSGFKAIELKNKISETSENERLLLEILSELRSEELSKT
jgi:hypothetical protein